MADTDIQAMRKRYEDGIENIYEDAKRRHVKIFL
jgi:hypothetical protein